MPKRKGPKQPAAAAPQPNPDEQPKLPRVWQIVFYSEAEVQLVALAIATLEMGVVQSGDHPVDVMMQVALQEASLNASARLVAENGGRAWVKSVRSRFSELVTAIDAEKREDG